MITDYFKIAFRNTQRRKLRSLLTMLGIIISVATIFVLISLSLGLEGAINEQFRLLGTDKIFIQPKGQLGGPGSGGAITLTQNDIEVIEKVSGVKDLSYYVAGNVEVKFNNEIRYSFIAAYPLDRDKVFRESGAYKIEEGSFLNDGDKGKIVIGSQYKYANRFSKPVTVGDKFFLNGVEFRVKGILQTLGNPREDRIILMSLNDYKELFGDTSKIDMIIVQVDEGQDINFVADNIGRKLRKSRNVDKGNEDFTILTPEELLSSFGTILNIVTSFLLAIAGISLLVGAIGIANTMYTTVLERTKEIGVMKAVGAKNSDVLILFLIESGLLGLVGGITGVILGYGLSKTVEHIAINQLQTSLLKVATPIYLFVGCLVFAFLVGAVSGVWPAWQASKTNTVDALRYE